MSVYNHRPMVPAPQSRVVEMLDSIRGEFDQLAQELYLCKSQRDDFELKMNQQISEMNSFQQSLLELERTQQSQKKHYEDEIARLRQQIEARGGNAGHPSMPLPGHPQPPHQSSHQPPPPNIGPGSNYFGGIMNAHGNQAPPGLVAPPQMSDQPPNGPPPHGPYPSSQPPPSSTGSSSGYNQPPPPPPNSGYNQSPRGMHTPPTSAHPQPPPSQRQQE
ncbi:hypothetical protein A0J61_08541, partial [Choanephora cucurbitarum]